LRAIRPTGPLSTPSAMLSSSMAWRPWSAGPTRRRCSSSSPGSTAGPTARASLRPGRESTLNHAGVDVTLTQQRAYPLYPQEHEERSLWEAMLLAARR